MSPRSADLSVVGGGGGLDPACPVDLERGGPAAWGGGGGGTADARLLAAGCCWVDWGPGSVLENTG